MSGACGSTESGCLLVLGCAVERVAAPSAQASIKQVDVRDVLRAKAEQAAELSSSAVSVFML